MLLCQTDMPSDDRCSKFADYIVENYMDDGCDFPVDFWAQSPQDINPSTTNGAESFHAHLNNDISTPHPSIYVFTETLMRCQTAAYVNMSSLHSVRLPSLKESHKISNLKRMFTDYCTGIVTKIDYLRQVGYRVAPF